MESPTCAPGTREPIYPSDPPPIGATVCAVDRTYGTELAGRAEVAVRGWPRCLSDGEPGRRADEGPM